MKKIYSLVLALFFSASAFSIGHTVTATATGVTCFGTCNGSTMSVVSGGVGPFTYSWAPSGGTGAGASGLCAGSYTVTVTDNNDMSTATATVAVTSPTLLTVGLGGATVCSGSCTTLSPLASGGTPPYTYSWTGGLFGPAPSACPGTTTTYTVTVSDANGCIAMGSSMVTVAPAVVVTLPSSYNVCSGAAVCMSASATGGAIAYSWTPATSLSSSTIANPCSAPTVTTTYTVTATNGACFGTATTTVYVDPPITTVTTSVNATNCVSCDGTATTSPSGGTMPYAYLWNDPMAQTMPTAINLCAGIYSVTITDVVGCTVTDTTTIFASNDLLANFTMVPDSTNPYNFFAFNTSTGGGLSYSWEWGDGSPDPGTANPSHLFSAPGVYNVCLIVSNFFCGADTLCLPLTVTGVSTPCNALFNIADDTLNPDPNAHYVYNLSYGATLTYLWDFGDGTTSTSATPSHVYAGTGPYLLCLSIDNGAGCTDMFCDSLISADSINRSSGIMQLVVYDKPTFYSTSTGVANAAIVGNVTVAPNPFNETTIFTVKAKEVYSFELTDVLGKTVKSKNGISEKQFEISRDGLENGIYFYKIYTSESVIGIGKVVIK